MPRTETWSWVAFALCVGAYVPFGIGGWNNPAEVNVASYSIWLMLSAMFVYSSREQGFAGWRLPLGFGIGNLSMLVFAFAFLDGAYTFNLGPAETLALYGGIGAICVWVIHGSTTKRWSPRILFYGAILADVMSFYPQAKQYWGTSDTMTAWGFLGWGMWFVASSITILKVEKMVEKLLMPACAFEKVYAKSKNHYLVLEESLFALEQLVFIAMIVWVMYR